MHIALISASIKLKCILLVWLQACPKHELRNKGISGPLTYREIYIYIIPCFQPKLSCSTYHTFNFHLHFVVLGQLHKLLIKINWWTLTFKCAVCCLRWVSHYVPSLTRLVPYCGGENISFSCRKLRKSYNYFEIYYRFKASP